MRYYAGIGSRETPPGILALMTRIAFRLACWGEPIQQSYFGDGFWLRSGHAPGADQAFENGAVWEGDPSFTSFLPWDGFEGGKIHEPGPFEYGVNERNDAIAEESHPAWDRLTQGARKLHSRNVAQILGRPGEPYSSFVICWTKDGRATGGTGQAIRIADTFGIPVYNLHDQATRDRLQRFSGRS